MKKQQKLDLRFESFDATDVESVTEYEVKLVSRRFVRGFIEHWHYSHSINGVRAEYCFGLFYDGHLIGAAMLGKPATPGVDEKYSENGEKVLIELRRLCCIDDTPKNTESYFIGQIFKWLRTHTPVELILSYADLTYGHEGTIYKATNFELVGQTEAAPKIKYRGQLYHDRSLRTKYKGRKKPFALELQRALDDGDAEWVETKPKNIYLYRL